MGFGKAAILNVDDHQVSRLVRSRILRQAGYRVVEAATGQETLELAAREEPQLVLLDVNLPDISGFEVCRRLRSNPATASIPVIHISASSIDIQARTHGLEWGADGYLVEPVEPQELVATIRAVLRLSQAERLSEALNRIHAAIGSTLNFDEIMQRVVVEATRAIGAETASIGLVESGAWTVKYVYGLDAPAGERFFEYPERADGVIAQIRRKQPFVIDDAREDPRMDPEALAKFGFRSLLFVPLLVRGDVIGALSFHYLSEVSPFTSAQIDFATKLGSAISLALENARLYAEAERRARDLEALMEYIPEGITIADAPDVTIRMVSRHGLKIAGRPRQALGGLPTGQTPGKWKVPHTDRVTPASTQELPLARATQHGEVVTNEEWVVERPDGSQVPVLCDAGPIRNSSGEITGGIIAWRDISALKRLEEQLLEAHKMEAVGFLAGGVAQEFNNMLTVISGRCQLLTSELQGKRSRESLEAINSAADRLAALTEQLLAFAGRQMIQPRILDLNAVVGRIGNVLRYLIGERIEYTLALDPRLWTIKADPGQMEQMVMTLLMHARDAMPGGGRLRIATANVKLGAANRPPGSEIRSGRYVLLSVSDTGPELDPETRRRLFEPFFSTARAGKGPGLGLSTVYGIARQNGGDIRVTSEPDHGNRFDLYLPRVEGPAEPPAQ